MIVLSVLESARRVRRPATLLLAGLLAGCAPAAREVPVPAVALSDADLALADAAVQLALESGLQGEHFSWTNPSTGHEGEVWVTRTYRIAGGGWCREYRESIRVGGRTDAYSDRACRRGDSVWVIVE